MSVDPRIPMGVQPPQMPSIAQTMGALGQYQQMQQQRVAGDQQNQIRTMQIQQAEDERAGEKAFADAVQSAIGPDGAPDWQKVQQSLLTQSGRMPNAIALAEKAGALHRQQLVSEADIASKQTQDLKLRYGLATNVLNPVVTLIDQAEQENDPAKKQATLQEAAAAYAIARPQAVAAFQGSSTTSSANVQQTLPEQFDPRAVKGLHAAGLTITDQLNRTKEIIAAHKSYLDNLHQGITNDEAAQTAIGRALSAIETKDPAAATAQWDAYKAYAVKSGYPKEIVDSFGAWSPENVHAAGQRSMTPAQRETTATGRINAEAATTRAKTAAAHSGPDYVSPAQTQQARSQYTTQKTRALETYNREIATIERRQQEETPNFSTGGMMPKLSADQAKALKAGARERYDNVVREIDQNFKMLSAGSGGQDEEPAPDDPETPQIDQSGDPLTLARGILQQHGKDSSAAAIQTFLSHPTNRQLLGLA